MADDLSKWAKEVDKWASKIGPPSATAATTTKAKPKKPEDVASIATHNILAEAEAIARAAEAKIKAAAPAVTYQAEEPDWQQLTLDLEQYVDAANITKNKLLSSRNRFMVWAAAVTKAISTRINSLSLAAKWWDFLTKLCQEGFVAVWGDQPLGPNCKTCKPEADTIIYDGSAPETIQEIDYMLGKIFKLKGDYASFKVTLLNLEKCYETQQALPKLIAQGDDFYRAGRWSYNIILSGSIARALAEGRTI